jgi:hypothetical protein
MTRLLTTGYESGDINEAGTSTIGSGGALTCASSTPTPRAGNFCLKAAATGVGTFNATHKTIALPSAQTDVWLRFAFMAHIVALSTETTFAAVLDAAAGVQCGLSYSPSDGLIRLYRGLNLVLLGTGSTVMPQDTWHVIEWRTQILTSTTGTSEVWLDGNQIITFSGDNSASATLNVQSVRLGLQNAAGLGSAALHFLAYDDIAANSTSGSINNGRPGDGRVLMLTPDGAGSSTQLTRGGTDTGANFSQVNELPPSMTQYVSSATVGQRDLYTLSNLGVAVQSVNCVEGVLFAVNSDASGGSIAPTIRSGGTTNEGTATGLSTSAAYVRQLWETDPATGAAWTAAAVDAAELGATVR